MTMTIELSEFSRKIREAVQKFLSFRGEIEADLESKILPMATDFFALLPEHLSDRQFTLPQGKKHEELPSLLFENRQEKNKKVNEVRNYEKHSELPFIQKKTVEVLMEKAASIGYRTKECYLPQSKEIIIEVSKALPEPSHRSLDWLFIKN